MYLSRTDVVSVTWKDRKTKTQNANFVLPLIRLSETQAASISLSSFELCYRKERLLVSSFDIRFRDGNTRISNQRVVAFTGETQVAHYRDLCV